nr:hypothetical protein [Streptomyces sp. TLI_235]
MMISQSDARGQVLLLAATPRQSRHGLLDTELGASVIGAVPPRALLPGWVGPVDVVQLVHPGEPQAVLARIRAAAAAGGPVLIYICGRLSRDPRQRQVHIALARTTDSTVRYTALPWSWVFQALAGRSPGATAVVLDVLADPSWVPMSDADLQLPPQVARCGVVSPSARRGQLQVPAYTQALARILSTGPDGVNLRELHHLAASQAQLPEGTVVLSPPQPVEPPMACPSQPPTSLSAVLPPAPATVEPAIDLRPAIGEALRAGHHHAAAELAAHWESAVLRSAGRGSPAMGDVLEVQAATAAAAGVAVRAAERWIATAEHRLYWTDPRDRAVQLAARNALHCWQKLDDDEPEWAELGRRLTEVLHAVGRASAAAAAKKRLTDLQDLPTACSSQGVCLALHAAVGRLRSGVEGAGDGGLVQDVAQDVRRTRPVPAQRGEDVV